MSLTTVLAAGMTAVINVHHPTSSSPPLAAWQVINLVGSPLIAIVFLPTVIDDVRRWLHARRDRALD